MKVGTATIGERNPNAKLTDAQRAEIVEMYRCGVKQVQLAARFGVTQGAISKIIRKRKLETQGISAPRTHDVRGDAAYAAG